MSYRDVYSSSQYFEDRKNKKKSQRANITLLLKPADNKGARYIDLVARATSPNGYIINLRDKSVHEIEESYLEKAKRTPVNQAFIAEVYLDEEESIHKTRLIWPGYIKSQPVPVSDDIVDQIIKTYKENHSYSETNSTKQSPSAQAFKQGTIEFVHNQPKRPAIDGQSSEFRDELKRLQNELDLVKRELKKLKKWRRQSKIR